jgi:hypothetical protein
MEALMLQAKAFVSTISAMHPQSDKEKKEENTMVS